MAETTQAPAKAPTMPQLTQLLARVQQHLSKGRADDARGVLGEAAAGLKALKAARRAEEGALAADLAEARGRLGGAAKAAAGKTKAGSDEAE